MKGGHNWSVAANWDPVLNYTPTLSASCYNYCSTEAVELHSLDVAGSSEQLLLLQPVWRSEVWVLGLE